LKVGFNITTMDMKRIMDKVNNFITNKTFGFKSLVNLHYDISFLGANVDNLIQSISEEFTLNKSLLTAPIIIQMLQASSQKTGVGLSFREYMTITRLLVFLEEQYNELKIDQKCNIFKYIAKLELQYHPMKYEFPNFFMRLKNDIKGNLEHVNENLLMSIIQAYSFLPSNFPNDLLNEIKEVFVMTLKENGKSVNSNFLIEFLENFQQIMLSKKKRTFTPDQFKVLIDLIIGRLKSRDESMISTKSINKMMTTFESEETVLAQLLNPIYESCLQSIKQNTFILGSTVLEIFYKHKMDVIPFLEHVTFLIFFLN